MRKVPSQALDIIKKFEGLKYTRYTDITGHATIGYGHECHSGDGLETIDQVKADDLLQEDSNIAMNSVLRLINVPLSDNQLSALIDFTFNLGAGTLERSTLRQVINRSDHQDVARQFLVYCYAGTAKCRGLTMRRAAEVELFHA